MQMHAVSTIFNSNRLAVRHSIAISRALQTNLLIIFTLLVHLVCHQNIDENRYTYAYTTRDRERERNFTTGTVEYSKNSCSLFTCIGWFYDVEKKMNSCCKLYVQQLVDCFATIFSVTIFTY